MPIHILMGEAIDVAKFFEKYAATIKPGKGQAGRPGLDSVFDKERNLTAETGSDLRSLERALYESNTAYRSSLGASAVAPYERAELVVDEIESVLEWYFDDGVEDEKDVQLAALQKTYKDKSGSADALAAKCEDYAALGRQHESAIDGLGGFDIKLLDEAGELAAKLREHPTSPGNTESPTAKALAVRNQIANLLYARMNIVRAAARFVFRGSPEIIREATSAYDRRRRAAARRAAAKKPVEPPK
ncbi:MAG: hypothetical protein U0441_29190 [Polyangiaceae bacterium]